MAPILYMSDVSPGVRAVLLTAKVLNLKFDYINIDLSTDEYLQNKSFLKHNPHHTIPTLVEEDGRVIWDSHAIIVYLVEKYGKHTTLYSDDAYQRAIINQRLYFDTEFGFGLVKEACQPLLREERTDIPQEVFDKILTAYSVMEIYLESSDWMAGSHATLADLSLVPSFTSLDVLIPIDEKFSNLKKWIARCEALPYYEQNVEGLQNFKELIFPYLKEKA